MLDLTKMREIVEKLHIVRIKAEFGDEGVSVFKRLVDALTSIYQRIDPSTMSGPLIVFSSIDPLAEDHAGATTVCDLSSVANALDDAVGFKVLRSGQVAIYNVSIADAASLSKDHLVYVFNGSVEIFIANEKQLEIINPYPTVHSTIFAKPTFRSLEHALEIYQNQIARKTSCIILSQAWDSEWRTCYRKKPEVVMRRSLYQFLNGYLQDAEVRPEQIVDESHPVDIKVSWLFSIQRGIIEIKWLGDSREKGVIKTSYRDARAKEGAQQLADYLDSSETWGGNVQTRGYLVIFDGRRRNVRNDTGKLSCADGYHYRDQEIAYSPDFSVTRKDYARPSRFFMDPICDGAGA